MATTPELTANPNVPDARSKPPGNSAGDLIMLLLLASLAMGLAAVVVFYLIMRKDADAWPPPGTPALPAGLWLSTGLILAASGTMHAARRAAARGATRTLQRTLVATLVLAVGFIISQVANWWLALVAQMPPDLNMFALTFYLMTGLHGLHVVGGLVPLGFVTVKAFRSRYTPTNHAGVKWCAWYWHFVDLVWLVMFALLLLTA
jgi:cytochrome c oxidase subunit 3